MENKISRFDSSSAIANRIRLHFKRRVATHDKIISRIVAEYFDVIYNEKQTGAHVDNRKHQRKGVDFRGVVELRPNAKEIRYQSVGITDISVGGVRIKFDDICLGRSLSTVVKHSEFTIIFCPPLVTDLYRATCKPIHISTHRDFEIGAEFVGLPDSTRSNLQKHLQL